MPSLAFRLNLLIALVVTGVFLAKTNILPHWQLAFSRSIDHRLQTEALARGSLALAETPYQGRHDWAWANGQQQLWGLGVPILRLPLEALAKLCGFRGFPDRWCFVLLFGIVAFMLARQFQRDSDGDGVGRWQSAAYASAAVAFCLVSPIFIELTKGRFVVYEETIAFGILWALLCLASLLELAHSRSAFGLVLVAAVSGFACLIRPTTAVYGLVTFGLALALSWRRDGSLRSRVAAAAAFSIGPMALLVTNHLRFGDPFEIGYALNQSGVTWNEFSLRFGYPFRYEPFGLAALETLGSLFFVHTPNSFDFYRSAIFPFQTESLRFREFYFSGFDLATLVLLVMIWSLAAFDSIRKRSMNDLLVWWSLPTFAILFLVYTHTPSITSRYVADFAPAVSLTLVAGLRHLTKPLRSWGRAAVAGSALALLSWKLANPAFEGSHPHLPPTTAAETYATIDRMRHDGPALPKEYLCADTFPKYGITKTPVGWSWPNCHVGPATVIFLADPVCIEASWRILPGANLLADSVASDMKIKIGLDYLERVSTTPWGSNGRTVRFCPPPGREPRTGPGMVSIGWVDPKKLRYQYLPIQLVKIAVVANVAEAVSR